jgi:hypothetical protein
MSKVDKLFLDFHEPWMVRLRSAVWDYISYLEGVAEPFSVP